MASSARLPATDKPDSVVRIRLHGWMLAGAVVMAVLLFGNWRLLSGSAAPQWDAVDFFAPQFFLVADHVKAGRLLMWDPWVDGGSPDFAEPELGTTSPVMLAAGLLTPTPQAGFVAYWMILWVAGGIGMLLLSKHLGAPAWGALLAALGYATSGFYTGHAEHTSSICSVSFLPWILWRFDAAVRRRNYWYGVQAGVLYGLSALGGYPQFTILIPGFLSMWAFGRVFFDGGGPALRRRLLPAIFSLALTIGIGAVVFSPPYAGIVTATQGYSDRVGPRARVESISSNLMPLGGLSTLASPYLALLNMPPNPVWPIADVSMTSVYAGSALLVFGLFGWRWRSPWRWWLVLTAVFFAACALGNQLPVRGWLYDWAPPTRYFRNPSLFRAFFILVIAILAALGTRDLKTAVKQAEPNRPRLWIIASSLAFAACVSFASVTHLAGKRVMGFDLSVAHLVFAWCGIAALACMLKSGLVSWPVFCRLVAVLAIVDAAGTLEIARPTLYTAATLPWWNATRTKHDPALGLSRHGLVRDLHPPEIVGTYPNNRNIALKIATLQSYVTLANRFHERFEGDPALSQMAVGASRLCFSPDAPSLAPDNANFEQFVKRVHSLSGPALVLHSPEQMLSLARRETSGPASSSLVEPASIPTCSPVSVSGLAYEPNLLSFRYVAPSSGWLLVTDRWAPGWHVLVNGNERPMFGGDFIFRAVRVELGQNDVAFQYRPAGFHLLLFMSWSTLAGVAMWELWKLRVRLRLSA